MATKREINKGDHITTLKFNNGETAIVVESEREIEEGKKIYYGSTIGGTVIHGVHEDDVEDHATAEEYAAYVAEDSKETSDEGNENTDTKDLEVTSSNSESNTPSVVTDEGNVTDGELTQESSSAQQTTQDSAPDLDVNPVIPPKDQQKNQNGNKNQQQSRRVR